MGKKQGMAHGMQPRGGVMEAERGEALRARCLLRIGEYGVEWGLENANSFSPVFLKDMQGRINAVCKHDFPVTDAQIKKLFPGIESEQVQSMQRKIDKCADCITAPAGDAAELLGSKTACSRQLLQAIYTGMLKFWSEIEGDIDYE